MSWSYSSEVNLVQANLEKITFADQCVLVTGGAGFLGSWICDALSSKDARIICLDNLSSGQKSNIGHLLDSSIFQFVEQDISEPVSFKENIDLVIHMASRASPFEFDYYPIEILKANTLGLMNSLELARKNDAKLLYASTSEIYGNPSVIPTPEEYNGNVNSIGPRGCYDEAKRCGEAFVKAYETQYGLDARIARIFNTYGPRMRSDGIYGRAIPRFLDQAMNGKPITIFGDGNQTRSFTYMSDQVEGLLKLAALPQGRGHVVNIGTDTETTIWDLARIIINLTVSTSEIVYSSLPKDDPLRRRPIISKARNLLGWRPKIALEEGLQRTIGWFRSAKTTKMAGQEQRDLL